MAETLYKVNKGTILRRHTVADTSKITNTYSKDLTNYLTRINQNAAEYIRGDKEEHLTHESLGFEYYTHATSPIRRFVDIINQINIINILENQPSRFITYSNEKILSINNFNKNVSKFYNNYKNLN